MIQVFELKKFLNDDDERAERSCTSSGWAGQISSILGLQLLMFKSTERQVDLAFVDNISNEKMIIFYLLICFCLARGQNVSEVIDADHLFDSSYHRNQQQLMIGEAALGGIGSTSVLIILMAILRILQIYKQRRQQQQQQQQQQQEPQQHEPQKQQLAEEQQAGEARPKDNTE